MKSMILCRPDRTMVEEICSYRNAMLAAESSMDGTSGLQSYEEPGVWLAHVRSLENADTCPLHLVTATFYVAVRKEDGRIVGMIDLRHRLNDFLAEFGGHIGYSVRPEERRKGYARQMLSLVLEEARNRGLERVLITCNEKNEGSRRTIERNGGVFERAAYLADENEWVRRYWIALK